MASTTTPAKRLYYLDNLRVALTVLVIAHHVGQAYGPTGGYWPVQEVQRAAILAPFFSVNRSFFMSLFFMISGYFMVAAFDRHGARDFVRGRLMRLGVPPLAWAAIMIPVRLFMFQEHIASWDQVIQVGHLWYIEHLLLFSLVYALWRHLRKGPVDVGQSGAPTPGYLAILAFGLAVALVTIIVRIWFPIDRWVNLLGFFSAAFADVPRDLAFFIAGGIAYRRNWFERFPTRTGFVWLGVGLAASAFWYAYAMGLLNLSWATMQPIYPFWEELVCCGMCIGLLVLFREALNRQGRLGAWLAENQYAAYVYHPLVVVPLQIAVLGVAMTPLAKFVVVTVASVPLVFGLSHHSRQARFIRAAL